jgi:hypothetical protein
MLTAWNMEESDQAPVPEAIDRRSSLMPIRRRAIKLQCRLPEKRDQALKTTVSLIIIIIIITLSLGQILPAPHLPPHIRVTRSCSIQHKK